MVKLNVFILNRPSANRTDLVLSLEHTKLSHTRNGTTNIPQFLCFCKRLCHVKDWTVMTEYAAALFITLTLERKIFNEWSIRAVFYFPAGLTNSFGPLVQFIFFNHFSKGRGAFFFVRRCTMFLTSPSTSSSQSTHSGFRGVPSSRASPNDDVDGIDAGRKSQLVANPSRSHVRRILAPATELVNESGYRPRA